ncbi:unnamed protein product [Gordionus sp. m RMFG-2023]|uniref:uncharacterized protein LOC135923650 n=1 Tax=Gordionus sp. m RMFG-2023 TaxID=3053472 RepID=UPI0030E53A1F
MSFTGHSPKDETPTLVMEDDKPTHHAHGIIPQFMTEPRTPEETAKPLGFQLHKLPNHPTRFPGHKLGSLPNKPTLQEYEEFASESTFKKATRKVADAPLVPLGVAGFFGAAAFGIYRFRKAPAHVSASSYFVQLRVVAQSIAVGAISALAMYQFYKNLALESQSSDPVKEAEREGKSFLLTIPDTHHKTTLVDIKGRDEIKPGSTLSKD